MAGEAILLAQLRAALKQLVRTELDAGGGHHQRDALLWPVKALHCLFHNGQHLRCGERIGFQLPIRKGAAGQPLREGLILEQGADESADPDFSVGPHRRLEGGQLLARDED
jgi:hypothetical protein